MAHLVFPKGNTTSIFPIPVAPRSDFLSNQKTMSYRGRQHGQRVYTGKGFDNRNDQRFQNLPAVEVEEYDPATDLACEALKIPYGQVFVGGEPDHIRSHEIH
ncbi:MAG: hypothetical protein EOP06_22090, partial [Proteobacteria bacterium]